MVLEKNRSRSRTREDTRMEKWGYFQSPGGNHPLTTLDPALDLVDPDRLSRFRYGVVTWIGEDGFPFSVATDFLLSENGEILLKKPSTSPPMTDRRVGVLFNHITGIPTGGFTEPPHTLLLGKISHDQRFPKLHPQANSDGGEENPPVCKP